MSKLIDLTGERFGRLVVIKRVENDKRGKSRWLCQCDCGNGKIINGKSLCRGLTQSCGCLKIEKTVQRSMKHGHSKRNEQTGTYRSWCNMKTRCINFNYGRYNDWGGRGITVCEEWRKFPNFLNDMKKNWEPGLTLERRKNEEGYYPDNCYWATPKQQARNTRKNIYIPYNGEKRLLIELCEEHNIPYKLVYGRIYRYGWSIEKALTTPPFRKRRNENE